MLRWFYLERQEHHCVHVQCNYCGRMPNFKLCFLLSSICLEAEEATLEGKAWISNSFAFGKEKLTRFE